MSRTFSKSLNKLSVVPSWHVFQIYLVFVIHCSSILKYYGEYEWTPEKVIKEIFLLLQWTIWKQEEKYALLISVFRSISFYLPVERCGIQRKNGMSLDGSKSNIFLNVTWCKQRNVESGIFIQIALASRSPKKWKNFDQYYRFHHHLHADHSTKSQGRMLREFSLVLQWGFLLVNTAQEIKYRAWKITDLWFCTVRLLHHSVSPCTGR